MIVEQLSQADIPVSIRIQLIQATVKALHSHVQHAYRKDDVRLMRRITVWNGLWHMHLMLCNSEP
jgi:hypothetical protein